MSSQVGHHQEIASNAIDVLRNLIYGYRNSRVVHVAARLGIADLLKDGARQFDVLARAVDADPQVLYRLLRALGDAGIVTETEPGWFALTSVGAFLRADTPGSYKAAAVMQDEEWIYRPWGELYYSVKTGRPALKKLFGGSAWDYFAEHPGAATTFNDAMREHTARDVSAIIGAYDFSGAGKVVDVGGGKGSLVAAILKTNLNIRAILFDLPTAIREADEFFREQGLAERCELVQGSFLESVPRGGDIYILKWVLMDWPDDQATVILRNCYRAMIEGGKLLVVDNLFTPGSATFDLHTLVLNGGVIRTENEMKTLLVSAGLTPMRVIETQSQLRIVECHRL